MYFENFVSWSAVDRKGSEEQVIKTASNGHPRLNILKIGNLLPQFLVFLLDNQAHIYNVYVLVKFGGDSLNIEGDIVI